MNNLRYHTCLWILWSVSLVKTNVSLFPFEVHSYRSGVFGECCGLFEVLPDVFGDRERVALSDVLSLLEATRGCLKIGHPQFQNIIYIYISLYINIFAI